MKILRSARVEQNEENVEVIEEIYNPHVDLPALEDPRTVRLPQKKRVAFGGAGARSAQPVWASYVGGRRNPTAHWEPTTLAHQTVTQGYNYFNPAGYQEQMGSYPYTNMHQVKVEGMGAVIDDSVTKHFVSEELPYWNLLSRTNKQYE